MRALTVPAAQKLSCAVPRRLEPLESDAEEKTAFENHLVGNAIPPEYVAAIEKGFEEAVLKGPLVGAPIEGVRYDTGPDLISIWG